MTMTEPLLVCPQCESDEVIVYEEHAVYANTFKHFCHSVKPHDSDVCYVKNSMKGSRNEHNKN